MREKSSIYLCIGLLALILVSAGCSPTQNQWFSAGLVEIRSGSMLISDPLYLPEVGDGLGVKVSVQAGTYWVSVLKGEMGQRGERIVRAQVLPPSQGFTSRRELGSVGVDSATLAVVDPQYLQDEWVEIGPRRDGTIIGADRSMIAELLEKEGYRIGERNDWGIALADPVSEEDEARIEALIESSGLGGMVLVTTGSSYDQLVGAMESSAAWAELPFADGRKGFVVAFSSGLGDGEYPVYGLYDGATLVGVEIDMK